MSYCCDKTSLKVTWGGKGLCHLILQITSATKGTQSKNSGQHLEVGIDWCRGHGESLLTTCSPWLILIHFLYISRLLAQDWHCYPESTASLPNITPPKCINLCCPGSFWVARNASGQFFQRLLSFLYLHFGRYTFLFLLGLVCPTPSHGGPSLLPEFFP